MSENREYCKSVAEEIEKYATGKMTDAVRLFGCMDTVFRLMNVLEWGYKHGIRKEKARRRKLLSDRPG